MVRSRSTRVVQATEGFCVTASLDRQREDAAIGISVTVCVGGAKVLFSDRKTSLWRGVLSGNILILLNGVELAMICQLVMNSLAVTSSANWNFKGQSLLCDFLRSRVQ